MSAPGASPDPQDLSERPINFLREDVDSQYRAFLEARAARDVHKRPAQPAADDAAPVNMQIDEQITAE